MAAASELKQFGILLRRAVMLPVIAAILLAVILGTAIFNLRSASGWVDHTDQVISQSHQLQKQMLDAETGIRGYVLNRDQTYLKPYHSAETQIPAQFKVLKDLTQDSPAQQRKLERLKDKADAWLSVARDRLTQRPKPLPPSKEGKVLMDSIRTDIDEFVDTEMALRVARSRRFEDSYKFSFYFGVGAALFFGLVLVFFTREGFYEISLAYRKALEESERSREWFSTTLQSIGDAVIVVDLQSRISFLNPVAELLTGWTSSGAVGKPMGEIFNIVNEQTRQPAFNPVQKVLKEGVIVGLANHTVLIGKDGQEFPIEDSAAPVRLSDGAVQGVVLVFRDVTEKHRAEAALRESELRFRAAADSAPVLIWKAGLDLSFNWFNQVWLTFTGRPMEQEMGSGWSAGIYPEDLNRTLLVFKSSMESRKPFEIEFRLKRHDGVYRWLLNRGIPRFDNDGEFTGFIGSCVDITDQIAQREALKGLAESLEKAVKSRDDFLSVASHELKTPLTALALQLQMNLRWLRDEHRSGLAPERLKRFVTLCYDQVLRLNRLIDALLDVTRIQQGRLHFKFGTTNISQIVKESVEQFLGSLDGASHNIQLVIHEDVIAVCDSFRITQVFVNLLTNAIKYGAGKPITVSVFKEGGEAVIQVKDQGIGIPEDKQELIFERFERAIDSSNISGLGLGLFIVKQIVKAHHGKVGVESKLAGGATFTVRLPINAKSEPVTLSEQDLV